MNKKGFISISVVYSFFLVFIAIIMGILAAYYNRRMMLVGVKEDIRNVIDSKTNYDCFSKGITKLSECILDVYGGKEKIESLAIPDFNTITEKGEYGLYSAKDNDGKSYYFRGDVPNNYIQFGQNDNGDNLYWRIVRINGDGTIRLIYDSTEYLNASSHYITNPTEFNKNCLEWCYNSSITTEFYTGWIEYSSNKQYNPYYIDFSNSKASESLNTWYESTLKDYYSEFLADADYCNDREKIQEGEARKYGACPYADGSLCNILYQSYKRLDGEQISDFTVKPNLVCKRDEDVLNVENGTLKYPIGLITADEVAMAGGVYGITNQNFYLYTKYSYFTLTAYDNSTYDLTRIPSGEADLWVVKNGGMLYHTDTEDNYPHGLRPVINLKADTRIKKGHGTVNSPYILEEVSY